jgi:hypothetical protein
MNMRFPWYLRTEHIRFTDGGITFDCTVSRVWIAWRLIRLAVKCLFYRGKP